MTRPFVIKPGFLRNVLTMISGTALAQIIPFITLPLLQRFFYTPEDFGMLVLYLSFVTVFLSFSTFKFEFAVVMAKKDGDAINLSMLGLLIALSWSVLLLLVVGIGGSQIARFLDNPLIFPFLFLAPVSLFVMSSINVFNYWFNRENNYSRIAINKVIQNCTAESAKISGGFANPGPAGLIGGRIAGEVVSAGVYVFYFLRDSRQLLRLVSIRRMRRLLSKYREFPLFSSPSAILGTVTNTLYIFLFSIYYDVAVVGFAGIAALYIGVPLGIVSSSFSQVFYRRISQLKTTVELRKIYLKNLKYLLFFGVVAVAVVFVVPSGVVVAILGEEWREIMFYLRAFSIWMIMSFISNCMSFVFIKMRKQKFMMFVDAFHLVLVFAAIYTGHQLYGEPLITVWWLAIAQAAFYGSSILLAIGFMAGKREI